MEQFDWNNFMQNILLGKYAVVDMYNKAQKLHIEQAERVVFVIELEGKKDATAIELVKNLFAAKTRDFGGLRWTSRALCSSKTPERWERTRIWCPWRQ